MSEIREIPSGSYNLKLGDSFQENEEKSVYHALRFDFKPKSLASETETFLAFGGNGDVQVAAMGNSDLLTLYKGSQKPVKGEKECLLFFDHDTGEMRIEKLSSIMTVKKTRGTEESMSVLRAEIQKLREKNKATNAVTQEPTIINTRSSSESSQNSSESDDSNSDSNSEDLHKSAKENDVSTKSSAHSDNDDSESDSVDDDDDLREALEQQLRSDSMPVIPESTSGKAPRFNKSHLSSHCNTKKLLNDDLHLSESSDDD